MHIEAARNSTDDFNLFHDKKRWNLIPQNPFGGPIALGFQLGCFIETQVNAIRKQTGESESINSLYAYSGYEFSFAGIVKPNNSISLTLKPGKEKTSDNGRVFSNRLMLMSEGKPVIMGYKREFEKLPDIYKVDFPNIKQIQNAQDRSYLNDRRFFVKNKYMIVGNAKNFLNSAFAEQSDYIDEFADKVNFPQMYPLGLLSSALLERAKADNYDLRNNPMIYVSHKLCINKQQTEQLKSNHKITILVSQQTLKENSTNQQVVQHCVAYGNSDQALFHAIVELMPLAEILK